MQKRLAISSAIKIVGLLLCAVFLLGGCAAKSVEVSRAVYVEIDAGRLKFADFGFLDDFGDTRKLEVYSLGSPVFSIEKDGRVCIASGCISGEEFALRYVKVALYDGAMDDILSGKQMRLDATLTKIPNGFIQVGKDGEKHLFTYKKDGDSALFLNGDGDFRFFMRFVDEK